jgi:translocator protein
VLIQDFLKSPSQHTIIMMMAWFLRFFFCLMAMLLDATNAFSSSSLAQVTTRPSLLDVVVARTGNDDGRGHRRTRHDPLGSSCTTTRCGIMKAVGQRPRRTAFVLKASFSSDNNNDLPAPGSDEIDGGVMVKYAVAILVQLSLMGTIFYGLDRFVEQWAVVTTTSTTTAVVPFAVNFVLFYGMALKSRVFNPLSNARPAPQTLEATTAGDNAASASVPQPKRNMPSWTPPGVIFPIMWLLIIGPIRAYSSSLIYAVTGHYACLPLLALVFHLSIGDVWNTINNVERRYGTAVSGVVCVWLSNAHAAYQYWQIDPFAGKLLAAVNIWLTIATALVVATWRINPDPATDAPEPLYPVKGKVETKFIWFS